MNAQDIMTPDPACCTSHDTAQRAAKLMRDNDRGCLPAVDAQETRRVVGVVTDREVARVVEHVSEPSSGARAATRVGIPPDARMIERCSDGAASAWLQGRGDAVAG